MINSMNEQWRELTISLFQGKGEGAFSYIDWLKRRKRYVMTLNCNLILTFKNVRLL